MRAVLLLYRDDIAFITDSNQCILEIFLILSRMQEPGHFILDLLLGILQFLANTPQFHAGIFAQIAMLIQHVLQMTLQFAKYFQAMGLLFQFRSLTFIVTEEILHVAHCIESGTHICQFLRQKHGSQSDLRKKGTDITDASQGRHGHGDN